MFRQSCPKFERFNTVLDKNNKVLTLPVDQLYLQDFMIGRNGFPMNDVTAIVRSQNVQEMNALLAQCAQLRMKSPDNKDKTDEELLNELHPRAWQTPSEVMEIAQQLAARHVAKMDSEPKSVENESSKPVEAALEAAPAAPAAPAAS